MAEWSYWLAVALYATAAGIILANHLRGNPNPSVAAWWLVAVGWATQGIRFGLHLRADGGRLEVNLAASIELVALVIALIYLVTWRMRRQEGRSVGMVLLPVLVITLLAGRLLPHVEPKFQEVADPFLVAHLLLSVGAYGLLSVAAVVALLDLLQERALRRKRLGGVLAMVPSLEALERMLFFLVSTGFLLLTMSIASGAIFSHRHFGVYFLLNHKVIFSWATWAVFGLLVLGHQQWGWRGRRAVHFTWAGYLLLVLAYIGVKFVSEVVLHR